MFRLRIVGPLALEDSASGADVTPQGRKSRALLAYFAMQPGSATTRVRLANFLWADRFEQQARASLRQAISELRALRLPIAEVGGKLNLDTTCLAVDLDEALRALRGDDASLLGRLSDATNIAFLDDLDGITPEFDIWLKHERARLITRTLNVAGDEAQRLFDEGKILVARDVLTSLAAIDPAQERTLALAMRVDREAGEMTTLHRRFRGHCAMLKEEFGVDPPDTLTCLYNQLVGQAAPADQPETIISNNQSPELQPANDRTGGLAGPIAVATIAVALFAAMASLPRQALVPAQLTKPTEDPGLKRANALIHQRTRPAYAEAEVLLRQIVARDPSNADAWARLGVAIWMPWWWTAQDRPVAKEELRAEAIGYARRALAIDRNSAAGNAALGLILTDTAAGIAFLSRAVDLDPDNAETWLWLGNAHNSKLALHKALYAYQRAVAIDPGWYRTIDPYCNQLHRLGKRAQAFSVLDHYEHLADGKGHAYLQRANLFMAEGRLADAAHEAFRNLSTKPANPWFARLLLLRASYQVNDRILVGRLAASDKNLKRALTEMANDGSNLEQALKNPDAWWIATNLGARARQLLALGRGDVLLSLYNRRYATARAFHDHFLAFGTVAPLVALALHKAGRTAQAHELETLLQHDLDLAASEGDSGYELALGQAWLNSLQGKPQGAAKALANAVARGWRGQDPEFGLAPDKDPLFAPVVTSRAFIPSIAAFDEALAIEAQRFRSHDFSSLPI